MADRLLRFFRGLSLRQSAAKSSSYVVGVFTAAGVLISKERVFADAHRFFFLAFPALRSAMAIA